MDRHRIHGLPNGGGQTRRWVNQLDRGAGWVDGHFRKRVTIVATWFNSTPTPKLSHAMFVVRVHAPKSPQKEGSSCSYSCSCFHSCSPVQPVNSMGNSQLPTAEEYQRPVALISSSFDLDDHAIPDPRKRATLVDKHNVPIVEAPWTYQLSS
ncbi:GL14934 [Drosophila persimilis]|uniref:GL14934 n=1 Tax=Drosophila persimilis TaxID=7234 RepID=B4H064_DROPE|nr:GL14934 [Drosophila persimilis]